MASAALRSLRFLRAGLAWLALILGLFMLAAWIGSSIPRNPSWEERSDGIEIMVETNGIHTSIVMPAVTDVKDWRMDFPVTDVANPARSYTHVAVSWGEREIFLNTPRWADLSILTALRIAIVGGDGLLHVSHYVRPAEAEDIRTVTLSPAQYERLIQRIQKYLPRTDSRTVYKGYGDYDVFYNAPGRYTIGNTCNQWTSDMLAAAGVKVGWWTPFAGGVMKWFD